MNVILAGTSASPSNWTDLPCQCIKWAGKRQLDAAFQHELTFANHVHQFDAGQYTFGGLKGLEVEPLAGDPFDCAMVLFHDVVQVFDLGVR